jgi:hypothetical protein
VQHQRQGHLLIKTIRHPGFQPTGYFRFTQTPGTDQQRHLLFAGCLPPVRQRARSRRWCIQHNGIRLQPPVRSLHRQRINQKAGLAQGRSQATKVWSGSDGSNETLTSG